MQNDKKQDDPGGKPRSFRQERSEPNNTSKGDNKVSSNEFDRLQAWCSKALKARQEGGKCFEKELRTNRNFQNPAIFEKMVAYCGLDQYGSNTKNEKDRKVREDIFFDKIDEKQRRIMNEKK